MKYLKILLLFGILVSVFSCGKDDDDMGGGDLKTCSIQAIYTDSVLTSSFDNSNPNLLIRNSHNPDGSISRYREYKKDSDGKLLKISTYTDNGELDSYVDYTYNQGGDFPDFIEFFDVENGTIILNRVQVHYYNEGSCKLDRIEVFDENQTMTTKVDYAYLDDNCSYNYRLYVIDPSGVETLIRDFQYTLDSFKSYLGEFRSSYTADHNAMTCFDVLNNVTTARGVYQYNEDGYPISEVATYNFCNGTSLVQNVRYEYECE